MRFALILSFVALSTTAHAANNPAYCAALSGPAEFTSAQFKDLLKAVEGLDMTAAAINFEAPVSDAMLEMEASRRELLGPMKDFAAKAAVLSAMLAECA